MKLYEKTFLLYGRQHGQLWDCKNVKKYHENICFAVSNTPQLILIHEYTERDFTRVQKFSSFMNNINRLIWTKLSNKYVDFDVGNQFLTHFNSLKQFFLWKKIFFLWNSGVQMKFCLEDCRVELRLTSLCGPPEYDSCGLWWVVKGVLLDWMWDLLSCSRLVCSRVAFANWEIPEIALNSNIFVHFK